MTYTTAMVKGWICLPLLILLSACSHHPSVSEADTYLEVKAQQVQLNLYKSQVKASKEQLTSVQPYLRNPPAEMPPSQLGSLTSFLLENDCMTKSTQEEKDRCYRVTRIVLISTTRALDDTSAKLYAGQRTVEQLINNINMLVDSLDTPGVTPK